jgi:hypothetical protein
MAYLRAAAGSAPRHVRPHVTLGKRAASARGASLHGQRAPNRAPAWRTSLRAWDASGTPRSRQAGAQAAGRAGSRE